MGICRRLNGKAKRSRIENEKRKMVRNKFGNKYQLVLSGVISFIYFFIPVLMYFSSGESFVYSSKGFYTLEKIYIIFPIGIALFNGLNFNGFSYLSIVVQFVLFLIGWLILFLIIKGVASLIYKK